MVKFEITKKEDMLELWLDEDDEPDDFYNQKV